MGLDEYETRTSAGGLYPRYPVPVGRCFSVEPATGLGRKCVPDHEAAGLPGGAGELPGKVSGRVNCVDG